MGVGIVPELKKDLRDLTKTYMYEMFGLMDKREFERELSKIREDYNVPIDYEFDYDTKELKYRVLVPVESIKTIITITSNDTSP